MSRSPNSLESRLRLDFGEEENGGVELRVPKATAAGNSHNPSAVADRERDRAGLHQP